MGVRLGGVLSPLLFVIYMNTIINECEKQTKQLLAGHINLERTMVICIVLLLMTWYSWEIPVKIDSTI